MTKPSIVFLGNEQLSSTRSDSKCPSFTALIDEGYPIELLVIKDRPQKTRKQRLLPIVKIAEENNIPIARVSNKQELSDVIAGTTSSVAVLAAFGMIVSPEIIDHFPFGIINIHPSLLPKYRGPTPIETALLNADKVTGVSLMALTAQMDAGPIYGFVTYELKASETKQSLSDNLGEVGSKLLISLLPGILDGSIQPQPQDDTQATSSKMLAPEDSILDFSKNSARLVREIAAYLDWPGSKMKIDKTQLVVTQAHSTPDSSGGKSGEMVIDKSAGTIAVQCSGGLLFIDRLKPAGKSEMDTKSYLNGYYR